MKRRVSLAPEAADDIVELHSFLAAREGLPRADQVVDGLHAAIEGLDQLAHRGHVPPELAGLAENTLLEVHFKPYRVLYEVGKASVSVLLVADGRRDFASLLARRLLR